MSLFYIPILAFMIGLPLFLIFLNRYNKQKNKVKESSLKEIINKEKQLEAIRRLR